MKKKTFQCPRCIQGKKEGRNGRKGRELLIYGTQANLQICFSHFLSLRVGSRIRIMWVGIQKKGQRQGQKKDKDKVTYGEHVEDGTDHGHEQDGSQLVEE